MNTKGMSIRTFINQPKLNATINKSQQEIENRMIEEAKKTKLSFSFSSFGGGKTQMPHSKPSDFPRTLLSFLWFHLQHRTGPVFRQVGLTLLPIPVLTFGLSPHRHNIRSVLGPNGRSLVRGEGL